MLVCRFLPARAQSGASCSDAIRLVPDYDATISGAGVKWYVGNTFDLPMTVRFYPQNENDPAPDMEFDFTCTPGVYGDSILCQLFCQGQSSYVPMPSAVYPVQKTDEQGKKFYEVAMGEEKRNLLLMTGIYYDVDVYIKVTYHGRGRITMTPDAEFSQCMDTDKWLLLGRTLSVAANDSATFFVAPYANWRTDSVRYIWSGPAPAMVALGTSCDFDPYDPFDERCIDPMQMRAGGDTVNHTNAIIQDYLAYMTNVNNMAKGGMFYVKAISSQPGTLKIERIPEAPPAGGAILLKYDQPNNIAANNTQLYAISRAWTSATLFTTPTTHVFRMYIGAGDDFTPQTAIGSYTFNRNADGHWYGLTDNEMTALWNQVSGSQKFLYVRFECTQETSLTPSEWTPSECYEKAKLIGKNTTTNISMRSKDIYRIYYADWQGGDMYATWDGQKMCKLLVSGRCTIGTNGSSESIVYYEEMTGGTTYTIPAADLTDWDASVDADGYIYMRFYSDKAGSLTLSSTAPDETDPEEPSSEVRRVTVFVACLEDATGIQVHVSRQQTIRIYDVDGNEIWQQTVQPGQPQSLPLQPATYTLIGEYDQIEIHL